MNPDTDLQITVVLCTYNPRRDYLALALRALGAQTMPDKNFEVVVVDNNSNPPLNGADLERLAGRNVNLVTEQRQGLTFARIAGLRAARATVIVFVDDDNELDKYYLENAARIAGDHQSLGTFGGITEGRLESGIGRFKASFLGSLGVRNYGEERVEGTCEQWGVWEPIGAGLVVRKEVGEGFASFVERSADAGLLGRSGAALMSGEDTLMTRIAGQLGFRCSYEPELRLNHYIARSRLTIPYLAKLIHGHGRSYVALQMLLGHSLEKPKEPWRLVCGNFIHRCRTESVTQALGMICWDLGFIAQLMSAQGE